MTTPAERSRASGANAGPTQMAVTSKGEELQYSKKGALASVTNFQRERIKLRRFAAVRVKEITTLALFRRRDGFVVDGNRFASALAFTLSCDRPGQVLAPAKAEDRGKRQPVPWPGLSLETLRRAAASAELGEFEDGELLTIITSVERWRDQNGPRLATAKRLGLELALTAVERDACSIRTIEATDESKTERLARLHAAKLVRDRERQRTLKARKPRALYEAQSLSQTKPWEAFGISRRQWERRGKPDVASASPISGDLRARDLRHEAARLPPRTGSPGPCVGARATGGTEFPEPASEMKRSEKKESRMSPGSNSERCRGLNASRMSKEVELMVTFDRSDTIASLIEAETILSKLGEGSCGLERERLTCLSPSVGLFRLQLQIEAVSMPGDGMEAVRVGLCHLAPRIQFAAGNDNRLNEIAKSLVA